VNRSTFDDRVRTLLVLGRISNLPTVWSNLLAGWIIAFGAFDLAGVTLLLIGGSLLYVGGMYLNDYCDTDFDAKHRPSRPIPAGKIPRQTVGWLSVILLIGGLGCLALRGLITAAIALLLISAIVFYDFRHKRVVWAPMLMGICRALLYPLAASATMNPFHWPQILLDAIRLGIYVVGVSFVARGETGTMKSPRWPAILLVFPIVISFLTYSSRQMEPGLAIFCFLLLSWILASLWHRSNYSIGRTVSGLLAGIVLVDMVAVAPVLDFKASLLVPLFIMAMLLQRLVPAT
jgi:hypothetical protein